MRSMTDEGLSVRRRSSSRAMHGLIVVRRRAQLRVPHPKANAEHSSATSLREAIFSRFAGEGVRAGLQTP